MVFGGINFIANIIVIITICVDISTDGLTINTNVTIPELGSLKGSTSKSAWSYQTIYQFRGIHFAESPSGERRFKPPIERSPWHGIKNVAENGQQCPVITTLQKLSAEQLADHDWEDCLHLSVYTKNLKSKLPVMFYVHGGAYSNGSASDHPPGYLLESDVVLVVTQYRIGALGFLTTNTKQMPGNVAVLDILLALEWVQKYIHHFGGDRNQVTIFGQSTGASIVSSLAISPAVRDGLFHRIIIQSGSIFSNWGYEEEPIQIAQGIAKEAGCRDGKNLDDIYEFFKEMPLIKLLEITALVRFTMTVGDLNHVMPETPKYLWRNTTKSYPAMGGVTTHDGIFYFANIYDAIGEHLKNSSDSLQMIEDVSKGFALKDETGFINILIMKTLFTQEQLQRANFTELIPGFIDMSNNLLMKFPTLRFLQLNAQRKPSETFLYTFDYNGQNTRFGYGNPTDHYPFNGGIHHSNDNLYIFPTEPLNHEDLEMAKIMSSLWTSFAITGIPTSHAVENWPPLTKINGPYLHINEVCSVGLDFLDELTVTINDKENRIMKPSNRSK